MKVGYQILADLQQQQAFKQWGFTNNTGRPYITFPFKFSNVFTAISCICHNGSPSEANTVYNVSISGMNIGASGGGSGKYWCAFGVAQQQWGFKEHNNTHQSTVKLPIAFKKGGYVGAANDSGTVTIGIKPTDKQTIELRDNNGGGKTGIYWFVVGQ